MRVHLPSGRVVVLEGDVAAPARRGPRDALFSELSSLAAAGALRVRQEGKDVELGALELRDFHALRAVAARLGWIAEDEVAIACRNCGAEVRVAPCARLELGPFTDGELDDPELDATLDLGVAHVIPPVALPGGRTAEAVTLAPIRLAQAVPLHRALRRRPLAVSEGVVRAMGIAALGDERDPRAIAAALARCPDDAWAGVTDLFLAAHYSARLGAAVLCPRCGARSDVDAPYDREFEPSPSARETNDEVFPLFDVFASYAESRFDALGEALARRLRLVVDRGTPACDDGGEPLLGSYLAPGGDPSAPVGAGEIVLYYATFRAVWDEDGLYDWQGEVDETLEHELEHHRGWLVGHDDVDDDERGVIASERARRVGRAVTVRRDVAALGSDLRGFIARTWPIWVIVAAGTIAISVCDR